MILFKYQYKGESFDSSARPFSKSERLQYIVNLPDGSEIAIAPLIVGDRKEPIWLQSNRLDELIVPNDLSQAIGEALEKAMDV